MDINPKILIEQGIVSSEADGIIYGTTCARAGDMKNLNLRNAALARTGLNSENLITCRQVHSDTLQIAQNNQTKLFANSDGLITVRPELILGVFSADCAPVFLIDSARKVIGLFHSGWRGTDLRIVAKGLEIFRKDFQCDLKQVKMLIGPHIRDCCYEIGPETSRLFSSECVRVDQGKKFLSLEKAIIQQGSELGVPMEQMETLNLCTRCNSAFYSYRRDQTASRMLSFISIRKK